MRISDWSSDVCSSYLVILVVGVNGVGKNTTSGKIASRLRDEGKSVMLAAGDTFRAAAVEQLKIWGERTGPPVLSRETGAAPAGLASEALAEAGQQPAGALLVDTAARMPSKATTVAGLATNVRGIANLN